MPLTKEDSLFVNHFASQSFCATTTTEKNAPKHKSFEPQCVNCGKVPRSGEGYGILENCEDVFCYSCTMEWKVSSNVCPKCIKTYGRLRASDEFVTAGSRKDILFPRDERLLPGRPLVPTSSEVAGIWAGGSHATTSNRRPPPGEVYFVPFRVPSLGMTPIKGQQTPPMVEKSNCTAFAKIPNGATNMKFGKRVLAKDITPFAIQVAKTIGLNIPSVLFGVSITLLVGYLYLSAQASAAGQAASGADATVGDLLMGWVFPQWAKYILKFVKGALRRSESFLGWVGGVRPRAYFFYLSL